MVKYVYLDPNKDFLQFHIILFVIRLWARFFKFVIKLTIENRLDL